MASLIDTLISLAALALLSIGSIVMPMLALWLKRRWGLEDDERVRGYLTRGLELAVAFGQAEARRRLAGRPAPLDASVARQQLENFAAELARDYAQKKWPDALAHFHIDTAGLDEMIRARMPPSPF